MFTAIIPILCNINPCMLFLLSIEKKKFPKCMINNFLFGNRQFHGFNMCDTEVP